MIASKHLVRSLGAFERLREFEERIVARGTWLYNNAVPFTIEVHSRPAEFAGSRFVEDHHGDFVLNEAAPIPGTPDGFVYHLSQGAGGEFFDLDEAKKWADAQPWGPVVWEQPLTGAS